MIIAVIKNFKNNERSFQPVYDSYVAAVTSQEGIAAAVGASLRVMALFFTFIAVSALVATVWLMINYKSPVLSTVRILAHRS